MKNVFTQKIFIARTVYGKKRESGFILLVVIGMHFFLTSYLFLLFCQLSLHKQLVITRENYWNNVVTARIALHHLLAYAKHHFDTLIVRTEGNSVFARTYEREGGLSIYEDVRIHKEKKNTLLVTLKLFCDAQEKVFLICYLENSDEQFFVTHFTLSPSV